jgi:peptidoglycan/LPS O-acetylase OafA/YrhL
VLTHRRDIDGLRAIAVLSVVVYHCAPGLLPGGFTGVDIFFVISGFLITSIIAPGLERGDFSLAEFYVRRSKRILPALFTVLAFTLAAGAFLLTPSALAELGKQTTAAAAFVSNIAFWLDTGYFDAAAETKPLLHTWSLGVEEQFYLLWPLALMILAKLNLATRVPVLLALAASFALSCVTVAWHQPTAFYLLPTRAWELMAGAVLALNIVRPFASARAREIAGLSGLALIVAGLVVLDASVPFPGASALLPCVGAALVIQAGRGGDNRAARFLSLQPFVFVGLISYSLYLWHWPLLVFGRVTQAGPLTHVQAFSLAAVAVVFATLTWWFVETPFRARGAIRIRWPILARYAALSVLVAAIGWAVYASRGLVDYASPGIVRTEIARRDDNPMGHRCLMRAATPDVARPECVAGGERFAKRIALWGDSHADAAMPGIADAAAKLGFATEQLTMAACPPLLGVRVESPDFNGGACATFNRDVLAHLESSPDVGTVVLSARWPVYTENARFGEDPGPITYLVDDADAAWSSAASRRVFSRALDATVERLRAAGKSVVVLGTVPAMGVNYPECIARRYLPLSRERLCDVSEQSFLAQASFADAEVERIAGARGACRFLPRAVLCRDGRCRGEAEGQILYANDDHLSARGARYLAGRWDLAACLGNPSPGAHPHGSGSQN